MKRISFLLTITALMVFSFGQVQAQGPADISAVLVQGSVGVGQVGNGVNVRWNLLYTNTTGFPVSGGTNGFRVYTASGGNFTAVTFPANFDTLPGAWGVGIKGGWDLVQGIKTFGADGSGDDTCVVGGAALLGPGIPNGTVSSPTARIQTIPSLEGDTLCLDSSGFYPPGGPWLWSLGGGGGTTFPTHNLPLCYEVFTPPCTTAEISNEGGFPASFNHCVVAQYDFNNTTGHPVAWSVDAGPGAINASGVWSYAATLADACGPDQLLRIILTDNSPCGADTVEVNLSFDNVGVANFTDGCGDSLNVAKGNSIQFDIDANSADCDPITYYIAGVNPAPAGSYSIDPNTGNVTFNSDEADAPTCFEFTIGATDGCDSVATCVTKVCVLATEPFVVVIEKTHQSYQGQHEYVDVTVEAGSEQLGGFDLLFCYDRSCLNFQSVSAGDLHSQCGWEYYTYRTWFWPSYEPHFFWGGCVRVIAIADQNNGNNHPSCNTLPTPYTLFTIDVLVTDNRLFECQYCAIRFFWTDCGDNVFSNISGDTLWVSREVIEFGSGQNIADGNVGFPTYQGFQDACYDLQGPGKPLPIPFIDFYNGGVDVACADSIDARGDINLNGISNEIADAVVLTNYFIYGIGAFHINVQGQIAASDVNADGLALTVGDLVYLIRVIVGDALPYPKLAPVAASYVVNDGIVSVDAEMGAAAVIVRGNASPVLLAEGMEMKYAYDAKENVTRVIVYSYEGNGFSGDFLNANGEVVSMELGSYEGAVVKATEIPADYALNQNYPNPFNPSTNISFNLPKKADYTLTIYNVTGQMVKEFAGSADAGQVQVTFDASNLASGIYFYKLATEEFSATKKMVLLK
jgi:hypothetical protein